MNPLRLSFLLPLALVAATLAAAPAHASDPCHDGTTLWRDGVLLGVLVPGDCVGAYAGHTGNCYQVHWGYMGPGFGVGGHNTCYVMVYVAPAGLGTVELPPWLRDVLA